MASVQVTAVNSYGFLGYAVILSIISVFAVDGSSENIFSQGFHLTNGIFIYFPHGYGIGTCVGWFAVVGIDIIRCSCTAVKLFGNYFFLLGFYIDGIQTGTAFFVVPLDIGCIAFDCCQRQTFHLFIHLPFCDFLSA